MSVLAVLCYSARTFAQGVSFDAPSGGTFSYSPTTFSYTIPSASSILGDTGSIAISGDFSGPAPGSAGALASDDATDVSFLFSDGATTYESFTGLTGEFDPSPLEPGLVFFQAFSPSGGYGVAFDSLYSSFSPTVSGASSTLGAVGGTYYPAPENSSWVAFGALLAAGGLFLAMKKRKSDILS